MPSARLLPHNNQVRADIQTYLEDARAIAAECAKKAGKSQEFRGIYKTTLAADCVLEQLSTGDERPRLDAARGLIQRFPILIAFGQLSASNNELRRFIEVALWCVYFTDHPVEWEAFTRYPDKGFARDLSAPIAYCAFRERAFYHNYAVELLGREPSGIAKDAATELGAIVNNLNNQVHAGRVAAIGSLVPAWDEPTTQDLSQAAETVRKVCRNVCLILAAYFVERFDQLPPVERAWFNWLVGRDVTKQVRAGPFGLQR